LHLLVIVVAVAVVGVDAVLVLRAAEAHPRVLARAHARHGALAVVGALRLADGCKEERVRWRGERWREWVVEIQLANPGSQMPVKGAAGWYGVKGGEMEKAKSMMLYGEIFAYDAAIGSGYSYVF
jgi:hypothetical protein